MIDIELYKNFLLEHLPNAKLASGGSEINCKCLYCSDNKRHMYVSIPSRPEDPSMYNCFKCGARGIVDDKVLQDWNTYDDSMAVALINHNKNIKVKSVVGSRMVASLSNRYAKNDQLTLDKLEFINKRLGTNLTIKNCLDLKIVLNLKDLLSQNNITEYTRHMHIVNELDMGFIGFISLDNSFVNLRRIVPEGTVYKDIDKRYVNYNIFGKYDNAERFYTIPTTVNLNTTERIKLHIAEGPFDILSIYLNLRNQEPGIYTCVAGSNYLGIVKHFILSMKLNFIEIHLYPDEGNGGEEYKVREISELVAPMGIPVFIHRNKMLGEKDMGVSPDRIKEEIYQLI